MSRIPQIFKKLLFNIPIRARRVVKIGCDFCIIPVSVILAFWLRFEWVVPADELLSMLIFMGQTTALSVTLFFLFGAYSEMWVYWSFRDLKRLLMLHSTVVLSIYLANAVFHIYPLPRSIYILYWVLASGFLASFRVAARILMMVPSTSQNHRKRILILGAGQSGEMLARQILNHPDLHSRVLGFLDDDEHKIGRTIHGLKVFGPIDTLPEVVRDREIHEVVIAIATANSKQMQYMVGLCEQAKVPFKTVPGIRDIVNGKLTYRDIRPVQIEDLLGREPYAMDLDRIHNLISGKTVMVTGAAGSIGSELCRQIQRFRPKTIIALDKDENGLFYITNEMQNICDFHPVVMQLQNLPKLKYLFETFRPELIFHAAAYKHVPCMEWYPDEAVLNNFETTIRLADMAYQYQVDKFILISTDKAVNPVNMMGISKRLCELYIKHVTDLGRKGFVIVRFGNVIGSQGSVFPIFKQQIEQRKPITVTHPDMERYFMSIVEACRLVLEAAALGEGGCTFLLDMGEPIRILDLARQMVWLSGLEPDKDIPIVFGDMRAGEKLGETLWYDHEKRENTENAKIYRISSNGALQSDFMTTAATILESARTMNYTAMIEAIQKLIPECKEYTEHLLEPAVDSQHMC